MTGWELSESIYLRWLTAWSAMLEALAVGFGAGVVSTALMSILQLPFWRRWSVVGVLEWHENVCIAARVFNRRPEEMLAHSFLFHFLNGGLASMFYALAVHELGFLKWLDVWVLGVLFGLFLWIATLAPIHKPITGVSITRHPLGPWPAAVSILLHIVYGLSTAYVAELAL